MKKIQLLLLVAICSFGAPTFTVAPTMIQNGSSEWTVDFTLSQNTDVEVTVIQQSDSTVVRHLAAGVLGSTAPAPLTQNSLHQSLKWDGKDDLGNVVATSGKSFTARVRAGMSIRFDRFVGGNPYAFKDENVGYWSFNGMAEGDSGMVYISGTPEPHQFACIRAFDGAGNYVRTIFPFRGDLPQTQVSGFGVNNWLNGRYSPQFSQLQGPTLTNTILASFNGYSMLPINGVGEVAVGGGKGLQCLKFNSNGTINNGSVQVALVTAPALPNHYYTFGPIYLNRSHNPDYIYLSGYHQAAQVDGGCHLVKAADTGFWSDGGVFRINMKTGVATRFISIDSVPLSGVARDLKIGMEEYTAVHGVSTDPSGNVYVCDRTNSRIGIYDSNGTFIGKIADVPTPDQVRVDPVSGAVYVIIRSGWHYGGAPLFLRKYSGWKNTDSLIYNINMWQNLDEWKTNFFVRQTRDGRNILWFGNGQMGARVYRDEGDTVTLIKDFSAIKANNLGFDRIALDRKTETVFINNGSADLFKITDWKNPLLVRCSTSTKQKLYAGDATVSYDGQLYVRGGSGFSGPIERYSLDMYHTPIPFSATGTNIMCPGVYGRMGVGFGDKGLAVSPIDNHVAFMQMHSFAKYWVDTLEPNGTLDTVTKAADALPRTIMEIGTRGMGGVKFDLNGNLYIGTTIVMPDHRVPSGFANDYAYGRGGAGSVTRFAPGVKNASIQTSSATGSSLVYRSNYGPMSGQTGSSSCQCRSSRFDVDLFGRLFIPSGISQTVSIVDNNDNVITEFGRYGNWDEQATGSDIPFACPIAVAASDNFIYVNDLLNTRLARIQMIYALDNIPALTPTGVDRNLQLKGCFSITSTPKPFNPESRITYMIPTTGKVNLAVYDLGGRVIKTLVSGVLEGGRHITNWNATNQNGVKVAAGLYIYKLEHEGKVIKAKTILSK